MELNASEDDIIKLVDEILKFEVKEPEDSMFPEETLAQVLHGTSLKSSEQQIEERKSSRPIKRIKQPKEKLEDTKKSPVYIGICVESTIRHQALDILLETLNSLNSFYCENSISQDIKEISALQQKQISKWKYPNSYHITCLFIGGNHEKCKTSEFTNFIPDIDAVISITHIVYSPSSIACAKAEVINPQVAVENRFPHITLLLGNKPAKYSNTILQNVGFDSDFNRNSFIDQKSEQVVFSYKVPEPLQVVGRTKYFY